MIDAFQRYQRSSFPQRVLTVTIKPITYITYHYSNHFELLAQNWISWKTSSESIFVKINFCQNPFSSESIFVRITKGGKECPITTSKSLYFFITFDLIDAFQRYQRSSFPQRVLTVTIKPVTWITNSLVKSLWMPEYKLWLTLVYTQLSKQRVS